DSFDLYLDDIARLERTDTGRRTGKNHITGKKSECLRSVGHNTSERENELRGVAVLTHLTVHAGCHAHVLDIFGIGLNDRAERAEGVEALSPRPLPVLHLDVTGRHVV